MGKRKTIIEFIKDSELIHSNKYDYSSVFYINNKSKVKIICPEHGIFEQRPNDHLSGKGCSKCAGRNKSNLELINEFKKIHGDKYSYNLINYKNKQNKITINCFIHGEFIQTPNSHLSGCGCPKCGKKNKKTIDNFIIDAKLKHGDKYDYSLIEYENSESKIKIICSLHGIFEQKATSHLSGCGCPKCNLSKGELLIIDYLLKNNIKFSPQHQFNDCVHIKKLSFDFYLPDYNICVEYNGKQHYEEIKIFGGKEKFLIQEIRDKIKKKYCVDNNIILLIIKYNENIINKLNDILDVRK